VTDTSLWQTPIPALDQNHLAQARQRQDGLTKPPGSLGRLEQLAITLCAQQACERPSLERVRIAVFAADHGVCAERVSAFPQAVTGQMIANFVAGGAAISVMARHLGAELEVINLGTATPPPASQGVVDERIAAGTANLARGPAMSHAQLQAALAAGDRAAGRAAEGGAQLLIGGEMGIGNTTSAAAVACALLAEPAERLAGRGTGLGDDGLHHKIQVLETALARHGESREPLTVLASLGGFEIAALAGFLLGGAARRLPILVDGFIVSVAALAAVRMQPDLLAWLHFGHQSAEPGHARVLRALQAQPLLNLGMRLGEGSGAAVAVSLMRAACALHNGMASFAEAGVSESHPAAGDAP
tara:strand:+ start:7247 stop:8320 length:1074 start_codon:yes stop_codon:yes gene_type:complete